MEQPGESWKSANPQTKLLDLPRDVMIIIFIKLGLMDLILNAQCVCSTWRTIAKDPQLYRVLHIIKPSDISKTEFELVEAVTIEAVRRSRGQLVDFSIEHVCTNRILDTLGRNSPMLKRLRLTSYYQFSDACLIEVFQSLPSLEEVGFLDCFQLTTGVMEAVGRSCSNLKLFRLNPALQMVESCCDKRTFAIMGNMNPGLLTLDMPGNTVTDAGLEALVKRFTKLEYLGIRVLHNVANVDFNKDLLKKFKGIKVYDYSIRG